MTDAQVPPLQEILPPAKYNHWVIHELCDKNSTKPYPAVRWTGHLWVFRRGLEKVYYTPITIASMGFRYVRPLAEIDSTYHPPRI